MTDKFDATAQTDAIHEAADKLLQKISDLSIELRAAQDVNAQLRKELAVRESYIFNSEHANKLNLQAATEQQEEEIANLRKEREEWKYVGASRECFSPLELSTLINEYEREAEAAEQRVKELEAGLEDAYKYLPDSDYRALLDKGKSQ